MQEDGDAGHPVHAVRHEDARVLLGQVPQVGGEPGQAGFVRQVQEAVGRGDAQEGDEALQHVQRGGRPAHRPEQHFVERQPEPQVEEEAAHVIEKT